MHRVQNDLQTLKAKYRSTSCIVKRTMSKFDSVFFRELQFDSAETTNRQTDRRMLDGSIKVTYIETGKGR